MAVTSRLDRRSGAFRLPTFAPVPTYLNRFVGREGELERLRERLPAVRLLTLVGPGGSGKTRLAAEFATRCLPDAIDGVIWIDLTALRDADPLRQHVATAVGIRDVPGRDAADAIGASVCERDLLIVLDNCEHLRDGCAELAEQVLRRCPKLRILATSREALGVAGEHAWRVPLLSVATVNSGQAATDERQEALASEAVRLFVDRAHAVCPTFELDDSNRAAVVEICRRLEGLPLAIELAAARSRLLAAHDIVDRLDDGFALLADSGRPMAARHRTLRDTLEWSYRLLSARECALFRRISVFAGTFALDAVESVCAGDGVHRDEMIDVFSALVDKSLVMVESRDGKMRYRLLEMVRQFAGEKLHAAGEVDDQRQRHAAFYLALAEGSESRMFGGGGDPELVARLDRDAANFRAVFDWCGEEAGRAETALRLATALHWFWFARGSFSEGRQWLDRALSDGAHVDLLVRGRALSALGSLAIWQGDYPTARTAYADSVAMLRPLPDRAALCYALTGLGAALSRTDDPTLACGVMDEAVGLARQVEKGVLLPFSLYWLGLASQSAGHRRRARTAFEEGNRLARQLNHPPSIAHTLYVLAGINHLEGHHAVARGQYTESLTVHRTTGDRWGMAQGLEGLAGIAAVCDQPDRAARLLGGAANLRDSMGAPLAVGERDEHDRLEAGVRRALGDTRFEAAWNDGRSLSLELLLQFALTGPDDLTTPATDETATPAETPAPVTVSATTPALRVLALGPLQVLRNGELLGPEAWSTAKARELLVFLLCHPAGCTRDRIGLAFWPEGSDDQVRNNLHVTMHRLRRALGRPDWVVFHGEHYRLKPDLPCEFDATLFEREVMDALRDSPTECEPLYDALDRYRGDFLEHEAAGDWHLKHRDRLCRLYRDGLEALGTRCFEQGRYEEATDAFRRLVESDALHEPAYRRLMTCLERTGDRVEALRLYHRLVQLLQDELEAEVSPETTALYQRLYAGHAVPA